MTVQQYINFYTTYIRDKIQDITSTIGLLWKKKKQRTAEKKYNKQLQKINLIVDPYKTPERYVVIKGELFRIQFKPEGIALTDAKGEYVEDKLTSLQVLKQIEANQ